MFLFLGAPPTCLQNIYGIFAFISNSPLNNENIESKNIFPRNLGLFHSKSVDIIQYAGFTILRIRSIFGKVLQISIIFVYASSKLLTNTFSLNFDIKFFPNISKYFLMVNNNIKLHANSVIKFILVKHHKF